MTTTIQSIKDKIRALVSKTTENGATEAEALAAMKKVGKLLDQYNLSMDEISFKEEKCHHLTFPRVGTGQGVQSSVIVNLGRMTGTKVWADSRNGHTLHIFGMEQDVILAKYLLDIIVNAFDTEMKKFKESEAYQNHNGHRKVLTTDFRFGYISQMNMRLKETKAEMDRSMIAAPVTGTSIIVLKNQLVNQELSQLGLNLRTKTSYRRHAQNQSALDAGRNAARRVNMNTKGISHG